MNDPVAGRVSGPVLVVGAGLLGTSVGLALRRAGVEVWLSDRSEDHLRTAAGLGAGVPVAPGTEAVPALVVVAVPPDLIGEVVATHLATGATVTDVGSVKVAPLERAAALRGDGAGMAGYVGGHPMAGSERSGPLAASADLFEGRPWAITPHAGSDPAAVTRVEQLVVACGAVPVRMTPPQHDLAVARTSHLPQLMSVLTAGQLADADPAELVLSGQGVRDVTRIAGSDPGLWQQIITGNANALRALLLAVRDDLDRLVSGLEDPTAIGAQLRRGNAGAAAVPGKHGGEPLPTDEVYVSVPDHPGELARLFADVGAIGANIEDLRIDHDPGRPVGRVEISVRAEQADGLRQALEARHWVVHR